MNIPGIEGYEKIKEYDFYIDVVLKPLIHPIYGCCRNNSTKTRDKLSDYPQFSLERFIKVFNFFVDEFSEYFKNEKSNFQEFANRFKPLEQLE